MKTAIQKAKEANIPNENITRAIQRGCGEQGGSSLEEMIYEGYGPGGVAVMLEIMTDNRNRTAGGSPYFAKNGGNLGETGCVAWMFQETGLIVIDKAENQLDEDDLMLLAWNAGRTILKLRKNHMKSSASRVKFKSERFSGERGCSRCPGRGHYDSRSTVSLEGKEAEQMLRLMDALEEHDDVQNAYANFEIEEE